MLRGEQLAASPLAWGVVPGQGGRDQIRRPLVIHLSPCELGAIFSSRKTNTLAPHQPAAIFGEGEYYIEEMGGGQESRGVDSGLREWDGVEWISCPTKVPEGNRAGLTLIIVTITHSTATDHDGSIFS